MNISEVEFYFDQIRNMEEGETLLLSVTDKDDISVTYVGAASAPKCKGRFVLRIEKTKSGYFFYPFFASHKKYNKLWREDKLAELF